MKTEAKDAEAEITFHAVKLRKSKRRGKKKMGLTNIREDETEASQTVPSQVSEDGAVTSFVCETCHIQTNSAAQLANHLKSKRHARGRCQERILAALSELAKPIDTTGGGEAATKEALAARLARGEVAVKTTTPLKESDLPDCITKSTSGKIRHKVSYSCGLCNVQLTSLIKVQEHLASQRHGAAERGQPPPVRTERRTARRAKRNAALSDSWFW